MHSAPATVPLNLSNEERRHYLIELHRKSWAPFYQWLVMAVLFLGLVALLGYLTYEGIWWAVVPLWLVLGHLMHGHLMAFHECSHYTLAPPRWLNEVVGQLIGTFAFVPISLYRAAHHLHHAYINSEKDEEMWPFTIPGTARWFRRLVAFVELTFGLIYTPVLFLRAYLRPGSLIRNHKVRRRIAVELALIALAWAGILVVTAALDAWLYLASCYLVPAMLAANIQSLRKYVEHLGLLANGPVEATRTVVHHSLFGKLVDFTWFNISLHGVHHRYATIPENKTAAAYPLVYPAGNNAPSSGPVFPSYFAAFLDMARHLSDPKAGAQWLEWQRKHAA